MELRRVRYEIEIGSFWVETFFAVFLGYGIGIGIEQGFEVFGWYLCTLYSIFSFFAISINLDLTRKFWDRTWKRQRWNWNEIRIGSYSDATYLQGIGNYELRSGKWELWRNLKLTGKKLVTKCYGRRKCQACTMANHLAWNWELNGELCDHLNTTFFLFPFQFYFHFSLFII